VECRLKSKTGAIRWVLIQGKTYHADSENMSLKIIGTMTDIHDKKRMEEEIYRNIHLIQKMEKTVLDASEKWMNIVQHLPVMIYAFDDSGNMKIWNKEMQAVCGYKEGEIISMTQAFELLYPSEAYRDAQIHQFEMLGNDYSNYENTIISKDGTPKIISWSSITEKVPLPGCLFWAMGIDMTEARRMEILLKEALENSQKTDSLKSAFLANTTHEIRTPLNGILGFTDLLLTDESLPEEHKESMIDQRKCVFLERGC